MADKAADPQKGPGDSPQKAIADSLGAIIPAGRDAPPPPSSGSLEDAPVAPPTPLWVKWKLLPVGALLATAAWSWVSYSFVETNQHNGAATA